MSDIFAQLGSGIRFPDANINGGGPLPTNLSGPAGINGDPDGRINFNSDLLSGIQPYAFGPGRMGSDKSYQQIPHRIQKIVPKLFLPYADVLNNKSSLGLSHAVDQGDIAFILQSHRVQSLLYDNMAMSDAAILNQQLPAYSAFINISTVNYILAGLQRLDATSAQNSTWSALARDLGYNYKGKHTRMDVLRLVSTRLIPFGICAGSEHQGGKHETGLAPVQAAVNHVTTMTVDGQNRDLVNFWRSVDVSAGDELIFKLAWLPTQNYTLNHYYKGTARQSFVHARSCWQLVPDKFDMAHTARPPADAPWDYDYRIHGYWRVAQTFQHRAKYETDGTDICNDMSFMRGQLLQVTFAPVWVQFQPLNQADLPESSPAPTGTPVPHVVTHKRSLADAFAPTHGLSPVPSLPTPGAELPPVVSVSPDTVQIAPVPPLPPLPQPVVSFAALRDEMQDLTAEPGPVSVQATTPLPDSQDKDNNKVRKVLNKGAKKPTSKVAPPA